MNALSGGNQVHCHVKSVQKIRASKEKTEDMSLLHIENALTRCVYASETDSDKVSSLVFVPLACLIDR